MGVRKVGGNKCGRGLTRNSFGRCIKKNLRQALDQAVYEWIYFPPDLNKRNVQSSIPQVPFVEVECEVTYVLEDYVICDYVV